jgi:hypothetical protein
VNNLSPATTGNSLRRRLIEGMTVRGFAEKTRKEYLRIVSGFAAFFSFRCIGRLPEEGCEAAHKANIILLRI